MLLMIVYKEIIGHKSRCHQIQSLTHVIDPELHQRNVSDSIKYFFRKKGNSLLITQMEKEP